MKPTICYKTGGGAGGGGAGGAGGAEGGISAKGIQTASQDDFTNSRFLTYPIKQGDIFKETEKAIIIRNGDALPKSQLRLSPDKKTLYVPTWLARQKIIPLA